MSMDVATLVGSKLTHVLDVLRDGIESGQFPEGRRLASENVLAREYGIGRNTIREVMSALVQQGYLTRAQGRGTFVLSRRPQGVLTRDTFAIFLQAKSHVFGAETRALVRAFQRNRAMSMVFDVDPVRSGLDEAPVFERVLEQGVAGLVIEGIHAAMLAEAASRTGLSIPPVAVVNHGGAFDFPAVQVVSDFALGTRLATRHLLALGRRRILFLTHRFSFAAASQPLESIDGVYGDTVRGYLAALTEAGVGGQGAYFLISRELAPASAERQRLKRLLSGHKRPDAVLAFGDHRAKIVVDVAAELGLRVPQDLAVVGYWNTPWAEMTSVPLTSVSIRETEIARVAAERLLAARQGGAPLNETVVVKPRLVVRNSCGAGVGT